MMDMVNYDEALKIAKELKNNIDACDEYDDAYLFKTKEDEYTLGGDGACIILKENGRAISQLEYFDNYSANHIREIDV